MYMSDWSSTPLVKTSLTQHMLVLRKTYSYIGPTLCRVYYYGLYLGNCHTATGTIPEKIL